MDDVTVEILKEIRDGVAHLGSTLGDRIDGLGDRIDGLGERLDGTNERLDRVEHGLLDLGKFMRQIARDQARYERFHHKHVDVIERDVDDLKVRVAKLEKRRGG